MKITKGQIVVVGLIVLGAYFLLQKRKSVAVQSQKMAPPVEPEMSSFDATETTVEPEMSQEEIEHQEKMRQHDADMISKATKFLESKGITTDMLTAAGKGDKFITKYASTLGWSGL